MAVTKSVQIRYITLNVRAEQVSQNLAQNTSQVKFTVWLSKNDNARSFSNMSTTFRIYADGKETEKKITNGFSVTKNKPFQVTTFHRTFQHNSNGTRSVPFYASITSNYGNGTTPAGTLTLTPIAQRSTWGNVTGNGDLSPDKDYRLSVHINRKNNAYLHNVELHHAGRRVHHWQRIAAPSSLTVPASVVNEIIDKEGIASSTELELRLETYNGNTKIGNNDNKKVKVGINAPLIRPAIYKPVATIKDNPDIGNYDKNKGIFLAGYTTIELSADIIIYDKRMTLSQIYFVITGPGYKANVPAVHRNGQLRASFTIPSGAGEYAISGRVEDQKGDGYLSDMLVVFARLFSPKRVTNLKVERVANNPSQIQMQVQARYDPDAGAVLVVRYRPANSDSWYQVYKEAYFSTRTAITIGGSTTYDTNVPIPDPDGTVTKRLNRTFTGFSETQRYEFEIRLTDNIGPKAASITASVGTSKQLLTLNQDKGVGIGKVHEKGELDVAGIAYFENLRLAGNNSGEVFRNIAETSSNLNGEYIKFYNGIMICWTRLTLTYSHPEILRILWTYPAQFVSAPEVIATPEWQKGDHSMAHINMFLQSVESRQVEIKSNRMGGGSYEPNHTIQAQVVAIGRY